MENDLHRSRRLDALRGVAILAVVTFHYGHAFVAARLPALSPLVNTLWVGVDLFFVLSGFLLGGILLRNREAPWYFSTFYGRRFLRIVPLYAVCVVGFFLLFRSSQSPLPLIFFVQNIQWGIAGIFGSSDEITPTWSLAVEEQFYLVLPLLIILCPPRVLPKVLLALILAAPAVRAVLHAAGYRHAAYEFMPARMDALFAGVLVAWAYRQPGLIARRRGTVLALTAAAGAVVVAIVAAGQDVLDWWMAVPGYSAVAIFFAGIVALVASGKERGGIVVWALSRAGLGAYSIYLFHMPVLGLMADYFGTWPRAIAASLAMLTLLAWACWMLIERPCIALGHRILRYYGRLAPGPDESAINGLAITLG